MNLPESFTATCCQVIRDRRQKLGLSQEDVAKRAGLARSYVCDVERGVRHPALNNVHVLAQALEISTSRLISEVELNLVSQIDILALRATNNKPGLHSEILEYFNQRLSSGLIIADEEGFLFFNDAAQRITGIGKTDLPKEEWPLVYGCYKADRVTHFNPQELPLVRAISGESSDDTPMFLTNDKIPHGGRFLNIVGRPFRAATNGLTAKAGAILLREVKSN